MFWPIKPSTLVAAFVSVGMLALGVLLVLYGDLSPRYRWFVLGGYLIGWYVITIWVIVPIAVIAQSVRNKRHGVFSHLRKSSVKELAK